MSTTRRLKWHPPPPPSPRILNLPRRPRRKAAKQVTRKLISVKELDSRRNLRGKLESLFDQERAFCRTVPIVFSNSRDCERRERIDDFDYGESRKGFEDEKERFQIEILRAECNFLRLEREIALKKLERNQVHMKRTLRSAIETLISGKKKIYDGKSISVVLEEEIEDLEEKKEELQRSSGDRDFEVRKYSNFDKQAAALQRRIEMLSGISEERCVKEIQETAEARLPINTSCRSDDDKLFSYGKFRFIDVENLGRKMEGLSKGMLERMELEEEYGIKVSSASGGNGSNSGASSASTSKRIEFPDSSSSSALQMRQPYHVQGTTEEACSGRCKAIIRKIVEQVRAETEQWSQMQHMLGQVREELEDLQASRDFWGNRALHCDDHIQSLQSAVHEWKKKAMSSESKVKELKKQISELHVELQRLRTDQSKEPARSRGPPTLARDSLKEEKEKRVLICHLKENHHSGCNVNKQNEGLNDGRRRARTGTHSDQLVTAKRAPLRDIGKSSALYRQSSTAVFPLHCPKPSQSHEALTYE